MDACAQRCDFEGLSSILCKWLHFCLEVILFGFGESRSRWLGVVSSSIRAPSLRRRLSVRWESGNPGFGFPLFHGTLVLSVFCPPCWRMNGSRRCGNVVFSRSLRFFHIPTARLSCYGDLGQL